MSAMQRTKGACGERELAKLLSEQLGCDVTRNLLQTRDGGIGGDLCGLPVCLEVKRAAKPTMATWWRQACSQAVNNDGTGIPVLAYRLDYQPWRFVVPLGALADGFGEQLWDLQFTAELSLDGFALWVRERLS